MGGGKGKERGRGKGEDGMEAGRGGDPERGARGERGVGVGERDRRGDGVLREVKVEAKSLRQGHHANCKCIFPHQTVP